MSGTFDPAHTGGGIALSNGNLTALATSTSLTMGTVGMIVDATQDVSFVYTHDNVTNSFRYGIGLTSLPTNALSPDMSTTAGAATAIQCTQGGNCNNSAGTRLATPATSRPAVGSQTEIRLKNGKLYFRYRASSGAAWPSTYNGASGTYQNADPALDNGIPLTPNFPSGSIVVPIFSADNGGVTMDATNWAVAGTTYNDGVSESGAAADTVSAQASFASSMTESGAAADAPTARATFNSSRSEAGAATDTPTARATFASSLTETGSASATQLGGQTYAGSLSEAGAAADSVAQFFSITPSLLRTSQVLAESRAYAVLQESRQFTVPAEDRSYVVLSELRSTPIAAEVRQAAIAAETRVAVVLETVMANPTFTKDPNATLDYTLDWTSWLGSDTIASVTWTPDTGITKSSQSNTTTKATIILTGGTVGTSYNVTCRITTTGGLVDDRSITVTVADR